MSWIDDYLQYTSSQESPEAFHKWCGVSIIASVLNRRVWLDRRSSEGVVYFTNYPGQISVCLVAGAGRCKKSTSVGIAKQFMKEAGVQVFDGKITPERLLTKLGNVAGKPILTVIASELSTFLSKASYNDGLIDNLIKLLDCESNPYETQKTVINITDPCLTLLMATTPFSMGKAIPPQAHDTGFLSRHIFVYSDKPGSLQPLAYNELDVDVLVRDQAKINRTNLVLYLRKLASLVGPFQWSRNGQRWFNDYYTTYRGSTASESEGYPQRRPDHLARLAMCLQVARTPGLVLEEWALAEADRWLIDIERDLSKAFAYIGQHANSDQQDRILKVFRDKAIVVGSPNPVVDGEELYHKTIRYFGSINELKSQMQMLLDAGVIAWMGKTNPTDKQRYCLVKEPY